METVSVDGAPAQISALNFIGLGGVFARENRGANTANGAPETHFFLNNWRGDVVTLVRNGQVSWRYDYSAFGVERDVNGNPAVKPNNPFRFGMGYTDVESGLVYLRNRYLMPETGRFITADPYWNLDNMIFWGGNIPNMTAIRSSVNLFAYVMNNPIMWIDPLGLHPDRRFGRISDAATDWGRNYFPISNYLQRELVSVIFQARNRSTGGTHYVYTRPVVTGRTRFYHPHLRVAHSVVPQSDDNYIITVVGVVHSHPNVTGGITRELSPMDMDLARNGLWEGFGPICVFAITPSAGAPEGGFQSDGMFDVLRFSVRSSGQEIEFPRSANHVYRPLNDTRRAEIRRNYRVGGILRLNWLGN